MGVVYRAHQASLERSVALKLMTGVPPEREAEFQRRFFLEAATAARLKHPNTITVFDYGTSVIDGNSVFYITMELLEGQTLSKLMARGRALPPLRAIHIGLQIARSLREAHKAGVVHRDLKPGNVMLVRQDEADEVEGDFVKVLDFGLAKSRAHDGARPIEGLTKAGTFMGSPRYVAPEQVEGKVVDARADIYSFGCLLFRMLAGRVPFDGQTPVEIMLKHINEDAPPLDVPGMPLSLVKLVDECLRKNPAERPQTMDAVAQRLKLARAEITGHASGIMVLSDERGERGERLTSLSDEQPEADLGEAIAERLRDELLPEEKPGPPPEPSGPVVELGPSALKVKSNPPGEVDWGLSRPMTTEDSTRPTRVLGQISLKKPPRRPWAAISAGVVIGLIACGGLVAWRLGGLDPLLRELGLLDEPAPVAPPVTTSASAPGPLARSARVRIKTVPEGADVLEVVDGLPRLLGITPLTLEWNVEAQPRARELLLRKEGYAPSKATLTPPAAAEREPVWLDVEATLRTPTK
jgi:serine/threonine-protein kinase